MSVKDKLLARLRSKHSLTPSAVGKSKSVFTALQELLAARLVVKVGPRYFHHEHAPTQERERLRLEEKLRGNIRLFKQDSLHLLPRTKLQVTLSALDELVDTHVILRLEVDKAKSLGFFYLHRSHAHPILTSSPPPPSPPPSPLTPDLTTIVRDAYHRLTRHSGSSSVFISDLAQAAGLDIEALHAWLQQHVVQQGLGTLDEGDWSYATDAQRAAAMLYRERRRLYVRLHP